MSDKRILLACPTYDGKAYAFERWLAAVTAQTYPHQTLVVDNSTTLEFYEQHRTQVPMLHFNASAAPGLDALETRTLTEHGQQTLKAKRDGWRRIAESMEQIRRCMLEMGADYWFNVEADVIVPPHTLTFMLGNVGNADWLNLPYWSRDGSARFEYGFGCSLFSRRMMELETFLGLDHRISPDGEFYERVRHKWKFQIVRSALELEHLAE